MPRPHLPPPHPRLASLAIGLVLAASAASAAEEDLKEVVVSATRQESAVDAVPVTATTVDARKIERRLPKDETDLLADDPDLAVARDRRRFGSTTVNIRGIEGNRVLNLVDGIRLPDYYNGGGPSNTTTSDAPGPDLDFLKRVEVVRGPASSLYGSDALGGVVAWFTKDPEDLLGGRDRAFWYRGAWNGADRGFGNTVAAAAGPASARFLVMVNRRDASELDNQGERDTTGTDRTKPNPQDYESRAVLAKGVWLPGPAHRVVATVERRETQTFTEAKRLSPSLPRVSWVEGDDDAKRTRASLDWTWTPQGAWVDRLHALAYRQDADTLTVSDSRRSNTSATCSAAASGANQCELLQTFSVGQERTGVSLQADKVVEGRRAAHLLVAGIDVARARIETIRDTVARNVTTGAVLTSLAGESFPLRDFPPGRTDTFGAFLQDEVNLADGWFVITPGLRYDRVRLQPDADPLFDARTVRPAVSKTDSRVSPKLAVLWQASQTLAAYGQWVSGFRAPNYDEVNGSFRNPVQGYGVMPNPSLEPETSRGVELGLRWGEGPFKAALAVYDNRYRDFIDQVILSCPADPDCIAGLRVTYQNVNLSRVRIRGADLRASWEAAPGVRVQASYSRAKGDDEDAGVPLNTVEPARGTLGVTVERARWGAEARVRAASAKTRVNDAELGTATYFRPPGYAVADLSAWWQPAKAMRVTLAVANVADRTYYLWSDVRHVGLAASDPGPEFYTQPGRHVSVAFQAEF
jgi:hemoglobin/transferrin/lactoferrin receptor protein